MHRRFVIVLSALVTLSCLIWTPAGAAPLADRQCFATIPGISNCIDGRFSEYWSTDGGLPVFGYPISDQHAELNPDDQQLHDTQWFERTRFEHHSELAAPYDVLLGRLGAELLAQQGRDWHNEPNTGNPLGGTCQHFDVTNRDVCGPFLSYWRSHGLNDPKLDAYNRSVQLFGLPLTGVKLEKNPNGDTVLTQWFERARFEFHPEVGNIVLLGLLGRERVRDVVATPPSSPASYTFSGTGQQVTAKVALARGDYRITAAYVGRSTFKLVAYKPNGDTPVLIDATGSYAGTRYLKIEQDGQVSLGVMTDRAWTIKVERVPSDQSAAGSLAGHGDDVSGTFIAAQQRSVQYVFTHDGRADFTVLLHCTGRDVLVVHQAGKVDTTVAVAFRQEQCFWEVQADGNWTIRPQV